MVTWFKNDVLPASARCDYNREIYSVGHESQQSFRATGASSRAAGLLLG
jgi:hypothetical protein